VLEYSLNIIGSEWIMIIFIALILLLGTNRFPDVAKKIGRLVGEYHNAKNQIQNEVKDVTKENFEVSGPVKDERKKLEIMANHFGVDYKTKTDDELKKIIDSKIGQPQKKTQSKK
jgi:sec-independent protein translocase protein TatA